MERASDRVRCGAVVKSMRYEEKLGGGLAGVGDENYQEPNVIKRMFSRATALIGELHLRSGAIREACARVVFISSHSVIHSVIHSISNYL